MEHQAQAAATPKTEPPSALPTEAAQPPALDPGLAPLDPSTIRQLHATIPGLPAPVLEGFSKASQSRGVVRMDELSLFAAPVAVVAAEKEVHPVVAEILATDLDGLSARQALELLHALQSQLKAGSVT